MNFIYKISLLFLCIFNSSGLTAQIQKTYSFYGFFNGANLNIQCRYALGKPWLKCDCIDSVAVNGTVYEDIIYDGAQIDIANRVDLNIYDSVQIDIYTNLCELRILNPTDFYPKEILPVEYLMISEDGTLSWAVQQNYPDLKIWVQVEQYKWGDWQRIGPIFTITDQKLYKTNISEYLFCGENKLRTVVESISHVYLPGKPVTIDHKSKKIKFKYKKKDKKIYFNQPTHFEIWNEMGQTERRGYDSIINVANLKVGTYRLNYGNKTKSVKIK